MLCVEVSLWWDGIKSCTAVVVLMKNVRRRVLEQGRQHCRAYT
jgi:hypothetical protein